MKTQVQTPRLLGIPCWIIPIFAGCIWFGTLLSMIIAWELKGSPHYPEMLPTQHLAYISNIGAAVWCKPLFIAGTATTVTTFSIAFGIERWLGHRGRLNYSNSGWSLTFSSIAALCIVAGSCGAIILTILDVRRHPAIHYSNVGVFLCGYIFAAAFTCAEKKHLSICFPDSIIIRRSYQIKLFFIIAEVVFATIFAATMYAGIYDPSVIMEWLIALFFAFYMWSIAIDFLAVPDLVEKGQIGIRRVTDWDKEVAVTMPSMVASRRDGYIIL